MGSTFVDLMEQLAQSNFDDCYVTHTDVLSRFRLYPLDKF